MKKLTLVTMLLFVTGFCLVAFSGCGSTQGIDLETYTKEQVAENESINAQLNILSPDAKASVKYTGNTAEVTVQYYAMTDEEIAQIEPDKAEIRCNSILKPVLEQFTKDTGNTPTVKVIIEGHQPE